MRKKGNIRDFTDRFQVALIIATAAMCLTGWQIYLTYFHKSSDLRAFVSSFAASASNVKEEGPVYSADFESELSVALINRGNAPAVLLKVFYAVPFAGGAKCETVRHLDWDFFGSSEFEGEGIAARSYPIDPLTVAPGNIVTATGRLKFRGTRDKDVESRTVCVLFIALNHKGTVFVRSITGGDLSFSPGTSSMKYPENKGANIGLTE